MLPKCSLDLGKHVQMTVKVLPADPSPTAAPGPSGSGPSSSESPRTGPSGSAGQGLFSPPAGGTPGASAGAVGGAPTSDATSNDNPLRPALSMPVKSPQIGRVKAPKQPRSASGLLTLIATVSVVGVAAAAIRAIVGQRASRALPA
jgi:hypothetical protein